MPRNVLRLSVEGTLLLAGVGNLRMCSLAPVVTRMALQGMLYQPPWVLTHLGFPLG